MARLKITSLAIALVFAGVALVPCQPSVTATDSLGAAPGAFAEVDGETMQPTKARWLKHAARQLHAVQRAK